MQLSCSSPICLLSTTSGDAQAVKDAATLATAILLKILIIGTLSFIVPISTPLLRSIGLKLITNKGRKIGTTLAIGDGCRSVAKENHPFSLPPFAPMTLL